MHRPRCAPGSRSTRSSRAIVTHACAAEAGFALSEMERLNAEALAAMTERHGVQLRTFLPMSSARRASRPPMCSPTSPRAAKPPARCTTAYVAFRERTAPWSRISIKAVLEAREG